MGERKQVEGFEAFFMHRRKYHCLQTLLLLQLSFQTPDLSSSSDRFLTGAGGSSNLWEMLSFAGVSNSAEHKGTELGVEDVD